ncbi:MAG: right-handed parallel beta-helix repeat-containing protein, partial [Candidatus Eisenbacteria bacterium]|nr:right-handed parallel beta-helix repeat-containing protein [Candidatus Eisenbacteria bacterium]
MPQPVAVQHAKGLFPTRYSGSRLIMQLLLSLVILLAGSLAVEADPDTLWVNTTWVAHSDVELINSLVVAPNATLTIERGSTIRLGNSTEILVLGGLMALGTAGEPIEFTRLYSHLPWQTIAADDPTGDFVFDHCIIHGGQGIDWGWVDRGMLGIRYGSITIINCEIYDGLQCALLAVGAGLSLQNNHIHNIGDVGCSIRYWCYGYIVGNTIHDMIDDGLNIDGSDIHVLDNRVYNTYDDGIDCDGSTGLVARNIVSGAGDCGMTFAGDESGLRLENNLIYDSTKGMEIKQSSNITIINTTIADNGIGIRLYENAPGNGGGIGVLRNTILWGNTTSYTLDEYSDLFAVFCDIQGDTLQAGAGNINADPLFANPESGVFKLLNYSPCIDAGVSGDSPVTDIEGHARWDNPNVPNTGSGTYTYYDIGCHEFQPGSSDAPAPEGRQTRLHLGHPSPNPFHRQTLVSLDLPVRMHLDAFIVDPLGRK